MTCTVAVQCTDAASEEKCSIQSQNLGLSLDPSQFNFPMLTASLHMSKVVQTVFLFWPFKTVWT